MTCTLRQRALRCTLVLLCAAAASARLPAQTTSTLTIALTPRLSDSTARAMIVREAGPSGRTLILLRDDNADAATLATALASLERSRRKLGDLLQYEVHITLRSQRAAANLTPEERRAAEQYLSRVRNAYAVFVDGVGLAKTVMMPLTPLSAASGS